MSKKIKIGLFGYGIVGHGVYEILKNSSVAEVVKICVKDRLKRRDLPMENFTYDRKDLLDNEDINLIVEVIDDAEAALEIVTYAMKNGKSVVTANKKMLAEHWQELIKIQEENKVSLLYEASACGSIPIIRNLEEYYDNELLYSVSGVFSGSCNYILTRVFNEDLDFDIALKQAQDLGFLEKDPTLDLIGLDASHKLCILVAHAYGVYVKPDDILNHGILNLSSFDVQFAREKGYRLKLVSYVGKVDNNKITMFTLPQFVEKGRRIYNVNYEDNGVVVEAIFTDKQFFMGKGAGSHPTGAAVISDVSAFRYDYKYEYKKYYQANKPEYTTSVELEVYLRYFDEKNLNLFQFEKITEKYYGPDYNYVIGHIRLDNLIKIKQRLNSADIQLIATGKMKYV
ncbi:MAG TPA: homoserine dehydrogenase [Cytophagales bacterium]|nr:homoserine dehydrogenase [Cytophagales bacterium]